MPGALYSTAMDTGAKDSSSNSPLASLERFVVDNDDLLALEERIGRFNIFDSLGIARAEIRHSNFLAWLLDPNESHGKTRLFLRAVLMDMLKTARESGFGCPLSPIVLDGEEMGGVEIRREWRHIDLLITCEEPPFVIAIENKVDSTEHGSQLGRYQKVVEEQVPNRPPMFVYLTIDGDEPSEDAWVSYTYADLHRVLTRVRKTNAASIGDDVLAFLDHYLRLIGSRFMDDPTIDELCQRIYRNHRQAIDLIVERGRPNIRAVVDSLAEMLNADDDLTVLSTNAARSVFFLPKNWLQILPPVRDGHASVEPTQWFCGEFYVYDTQCELWLFACPTKDREIRENVIQRLINNPEEFGFRHSFKKISPQWTTIYKRAIKVDLTEGADIDAIVEKARLALDDLKERMNRALPALRPIIEQWEAKQKP